MRQFTEYTGRQTNPHVGLHSEITEVELLSRSHIPIPADRQGGETFKQGHAGTKIDEQQMKYRFAINTTRESIKRRETLTSSRKMPEVRHSFRQRHIPPSLCRCAQKYVESLKPLAWSFAFENDLFEAQYFKTWHV